MPTNTGITAIEGVALIGTVDVVDPAVDGNNDGDLDDLGTDINDDGLYLTTLLDVGPRRRR